MKYKLINKQTGEEHICEKVVIDGWDYYVSNEKYIEDELLYCVANGWLQKARVEHLVEQRGEHNQWKKVIATNNPIDIPNVVDEVEQLALSYEMSFTDDDGTTKVDFKAGYNKSQETHPFSEEDMIEFAEWKDFNFYQHIQDNLYKTMQARPMYKVLENKSYTLKELLQLWKEQRIKTIYYE